MASTARSLRKFLYAQKRRLWLIGSYGQTGSGKSFTMTGHPAELGIIPCAVDGVFDAITADIDRAFLLRVSYIEIYNETLRDLLNFKKVNKDTPAIHTNKVSVVKFYN
jgi:centromeric protein E